MNGFDSAVRVLPPRIRAAAAHMSDRDKIQAVEIRLRTGYPASVVFPTGERLLNNEPVNTQDLRTIVQNSCAASPYTVQSSMEQGYITAGGGVRIGLCGQMNRTENGTYTLSEISSVSVRVPRQVIGCAEGLLERPFTSTLILSPPGVGKTTLLRDMIRILSDRGQRVAVCDERGEVAGCCDGKPGFDIGRCTDVMTGLPKAQAAMTVLRAMNPQILAMDEITAPEDVSACEISANCGVSLLATAHAACPDELFNRPVYRALQERKIFQRLICIEWTTGGRTYREEAI